MARVAEGTGAKATPAAQGRRIPALTGVRALAAFLVFFHHHGSKFLEVGPLILWWELHVGVTLFFVLSGFMITWRYDRRGPQPASFLRSYFVNRFARIYPLYLVLVVSVMLIARARLPRAWLLNLTVFSCIETGIPQAWSLRVEECFYLCAPLVFLAWRRHPLLPLGTAGAVVAALYPVSKLPALDGILGPPYYLLLYTFFGRFFEFYVGMRLARKMAEARPSTPRARPFPMFTLVGLGGIAAVVVALSAIFAASDSTVYTYGLYHPAGIALNNLVLPLFIASFYRGLVEEESLLRRILSGRIADLLGRSSYAFYLIHVGPLLTYVLAACIAVLGWFGPGIAARATAGLGHVSVLFVFVTLVSIALYEGIEAPANRWIRRRFGARSVAGVPATAGAVAALKLRVP